MTPERLGKIRRLAEDERGHPEVRQRAREKYNSYRGSHPWLFEEEKPKPKPKPDPRVHGMRTDPAYEYYVFMDLSQWGRTKAGNNLAHIVFHKNVSYRIVLFQHKKSPTWGWMRVPIAADSVPTFSSKFATVGEAHADAWGSLMAS